jgi:hypothetical protein
MTAVTLVFVLVSNRLESISALVNVTCNMAEMVRTVRRFIGLCLNDVIVW